MFAGLWYICMLCNNPATYDSPSIDLHGLLFVLGGLFALDGGGASAHSGYPLALSALWTCASSDFLSSAVVHCWWYCCALLVRVRTTERLWVRGLCHLKLSYWSICVGFR